MGWIGKLGFGLLLLVMTAFIGLATWEPFFAVKSKAPPSRAYSAEIIRDDFGVPHIYGKTDADVAFGVALAHAEDDFFTLQDAVAMSKGRFGAIAGEAGAGVDYVYHLLDVRRTAEAQYQSIPADTRALLDAYATGLNQYAQQHPQELKLAGLFPVSGIDIVAGVFAAPTVFLRIE